jgi:hypothetical protein
MRARAADERHAPTRRNPSHRNATHSKAQCDATGVVDSLRPTFFGCRMTPLERALQLRDIVLDLMKSSEPILGAGAAAPPAWERKIGRLRLAYYAPVTGHPFYGINIWLHDPKAHGKVLNIEWIDNRVELRAFKRGDWERELEAHARRRPQ